MNGDRYGFDPQQGKLRVSSVFSSFIVPFPPILQSINIMKHDTHKF